MVFTQYAEREIVILDKCRGNGRDSRDSCDSVDIAREFLSQPFF